MDFNKIISGEVKYIKISSKINESVTYVEVTKVDDFTSDDKFLNFECRCCNFTNGKVHHFKSDKMIIRKVEDNVIEEITSDDFLKVDNEVTSLISKYYN